VRTSKLFVQAAAVAVSLFVPPTYAQPERLGPGATLSAALGGDLGGAMFNSGWIGHGIVTSTVETRLGRSEAFRRRLTLDVRANVHAQHERNNPEPISTQQVVQ
jgi:hypothetical protein